MNGEQLVAAVAQHSGEKRDVVKQVLDALTDTILERTRGGEKVKIHGFGTFEPVVRAGRTVRDPKHGAVHEIPRRASMRFRLSTSGAAYYASKE